MKHPTNKKERVDIHKHKLKKLLDDTKHQYGAGAYYDEAKGRIIQYWFNKKYLKKVAAKTARKVKDISNGSLYKRVYDLWWELF